MCPRQLLAAMFTSDAQASSLLLHASGSNAGQNGSCDRILRPEGVASACHVLHSCSSFGLRFYRGNANTRARNELLVFGEWRLNTGK